MENRKPTIHIALQKQHHSNHLHQVQRRTMVWPFYPGLKPGATQISLLRSWDGGLKC